MNIFIGKCWRLHALNDKNFELQEYRQAKIVTADGDSTPWDRWRDTGHYFQSIPTALQWLLDHRCLTDPAECKTVEEAIMRMKEIRNELLTVRVELKEAKHAKRRSG